MMIPALTLTLLPITACTAESPLTVDLGDFDAASAVVDAQAVTDLAVVGSSTTTLTLSWTQVGDGSGQPASYGLRYDTPAIDWDVATTGCEQTIRGDSIGEVISCVIEGLDPATPYEAQVVSYPSRGPKWKGAAYSNVAAGETVEVSEAVDRSGIWIGSAEIAALPMSGDAWNNLLSTAQGSCGAVDLGDKDSLTNVCIMAKALVYARTGETTYAQAVLTAIREIVDAPTYDGRALSLGRELGAYVIAADLIDLPTYDPALDELFRTELRTLRSTYTWGAAADLVDCHEKRPNNWGAHCGATRAAIAVYLGDNADLERTAQVFKGYLGDRSSYAGFVYGGPGDDLTWQCDPDRPVGINPAGCVRDGLSIDGVLPDDQRRGGSFTTSPPRENYVWEALQGLLAQGVILYRAGYPVWDWEDQALLRAVQWLHDVVDYPAQGDDTWQPHIVNHYYGTSFPAPTPTRAGKNVGWTDWTHG